MTLFRRRDPNATAAAPPPAPTSAVSEPERARREAELRYWSERAGAVGRLAALRTREKG